MAIKWLRNTFLGSPQLFKRKPTGTILNSIKKDQAEKNKAENMQVVFGARLKLMAELAQHFDVKLAPSDSEIRLFEQITLKLLMEDRGIDWKRDAAVIELYESVVLEKVPAAKIGFQQHEVNWSNVEVLVRVDFLAGKKMSVRSACEHLLRKYPNRFPERLKAKYYEIKQSDKNAVKLAQYLTSVVHKFNFDEDSLDKNFSFSG